MSKKFIAGLVQPNAGPDMMANIAFVAEQARRANDQGATFVLTPENTSLMDWGRKNLIAKSFSEAEHPALAAFRDLARELNIWFLAGSLHVKPEGWSADNDRIANRSYLIDASGNVVAKYDKIHMFDVDLKGGESYRESSTFRPGEQGVVAPTPWGLLGMTICYDLRFPYLYRGLAHKGASMLTIPAAFTRQTGQAHWHVLQRARAIETGCYVLAPAQCGEHANGRKTFGHSLIVAPWGEVLADAGTEPGFVTAEIDLAKVDEARAMVPSLKHDRDYAGPEIVVPAEGLLADAG
ncbi:MAG: carbon-nitrogen hydrolase family protein [Rhodospirillales bacterium]